MSWAPLQTAAPTCRVSERCLSLAVPACLWLLVQLPGVGYVWWVGGVGAGLACCPSLKASSPPCLPARLPVLPPSPPADVHCFTLANVLRRPLLLYGDGQAAAAGLSGVYLPSLWPEPQAQCSRQPLVRS